MSDLKKTLVGLVSYKEDDNSIFFGREKEVENLLQVIQNNKLIGNFPRIDFFINAKIQQTRLYLKAEHINSSLTGYDYYSAPSYPYRDFSVRFGLVWNFFM